MKKHILFCIVWDILFWAFLIFAYRLYRYTGTQYDVSSLTRQLISILSAVIGGAMLAALVLTSLKSGRTKRTKLLEFLIIGLPALYVSIFQFVVWMLMDAGFSFTYWTPFGLALYTVPIIIAGMLLGLEVTLAIAKKQK